VGRDDAYHGPHAQLQVNGTYKENKTDAVIQMLETSGAIT
jgi:hypothetical protein